MDRTAEIAALTEILNAGVLSVTVEGVTTTFQTPDQIRKRLRELEAEQAGSAGARRPVALPVTFS